MMKIVKVSADTSEFDEFMNGLELDLEAAPKSCRDVALNLLNSLPEWFHIEFNATSGTTVCGLLKPSQWLLNLRVALRAGNFDFLSINIAGHCDPLTIK